jgi:hypothetical protein
MQGFTGMILMSDGISTDWSDPEGPLHHLVLAHGIGQRKWDTWRHQFQDGESEISGTYDYFICVCGFTIHSPYGSSLIRITNEIQHLAECERYRILMSQRILLERADS